MTESLKHNFTKRVIFPSGGQRQFLSKAVKNLNLSWSSFADKIRVHKRTLNDWKREEYSLPLNVLKKISKAAKIRIPKDVEIREPFWYVYKGAKIGAKLGGMACIKKYGGIGGNPEYRKKKWYEWWEKKGKFIDRGRFFKRKSIKRPRKNNNLAEFIGIMLGDGSITPKQVFVDFNSLIEKEYMKVVKRMIKKLFNVEASIYKRKVSNGIRLVVSRVGLVEFLIKLGLNKAKRGNPKDILKWIFKSKKYQIACLRGLIDTEGCVYTHTYKVNGKFYSYKKMCFSNHSQALLESAAKILKNLNFTPKITSGEYVSLYNSKEVKRYFSEIGSHNLKNLRRFRS